MKKSRSLSGSEAEKLRNWTVKMSFFRLSMAVFFLGLAITTESDPNYLRHECSNTTTFTPNSTYQSNLNLLLSSLASNSTSNNGFHNTTTGQTPDNVYGLFLCRGDVSTDVCQECVTFATREVLQRCPVYRESVIWYNECLLRYSNWPFFNTVNERDKIFLYYARNATNQTSFDDLVLTTMNSVASQASSGAKKFSTGAKGFSPFNVLYTLAQCTQDLSSSNCQRCLQVVIARLPSRSIGGRLLARSCIVRFETYLFYNQSAVPATPPASLPPPAEERRKYMKVVIIVAGIVGTITIAICTYYSWRWMAKYRERKGKSKQMLFNTKDENMNRDQTNQFELQEVPLFLLQTLEAASNNFHIDNKLGQGGFGPVYKGKLLDGQEIAVKRLSRASGQGLKEFMNEVVVISKLQHRNLVRLLGCCVEGEEKMLIYEYMPKNSLDTVLFSSSKQEILDWRRRFNIIDGIGRGLVYLHRDSRLKIIHRDLKASNVLLDEELNPKISDFGMARIFKKNEDQVNTQRIVRTYGYISPEYAMGGHISDKSDVFSFGVLLLEIISGRKNTSFYHDEQSLSLLGFAWKLWNENNIADLVDPSLCDSHNEMEIVRCIHVGMLCVQEFVIDRPTMSTVLSMLHSEILDLPAPRQPAFTLLILSLLQLMADETN